MPPLDRGRSIGAWGTGVCWEFGRIIGKVFPACGWKMGVEGWDRRETGCRKAVEAQRVVSLLGELYHYSFLCLGVLAFTVLTEW
jgi:hypothetical protein